MPALIKCPYCEDYTEMTAVIIIGEVKTFGLDKCQKCHKRFHFNFEIICLGTGKLEKR